MARPRANIDWEKIEQMAVAGSSGAMIAAALGITYDCLSDSYKAIHGKEAKFHDYLQDKRRKGDDLLTRKIFDMAMKGDKTILIFLAKCRMKWRENDVEVAENLEVNIK